MLQLNFSKFSPSLICAGRPASQQEEFSARYVTWLGQRGRLAQMEPLRCGTVRSSSVCCGWLGGASQV